MSITLKKIKSLVVVLFTVSCFAQNKEEKKIINIFFKLNDKAINDIYINKDSTQAHFSIYVKKYQTKKARDKAKLEHYNDPQDHNSAGLPDFSISFSSFNKPTKLHSLKEVDYLTMNQFRTQSFPKSQPMFFIYKSDKGYYLKWDVIHISY
jgi:hypothetical protein